jgi:ABC-2 type transport system permease protein
MATTRRPPAADDSAHGEPLGPVSVYGARVSARVRARTIWSYRRTLWLLIARDTKARYEGSALGWVWAVLDPLIQASVQWFVFVKILQRTGHGEDPYITFLLIGIIPWSWARGILGGAGKALNRDAKLVRSTNTPREIWILRMVGLGFVDFVFATPVIVAFVLIFGPRFGSIQPDGITPSGLNWYALLIPVAIIIQTMFCVGMGLLLAPMTMVFRDFDRWWRPLLRVYYFANPILYSVQSVKERLPIFFHLYAINPLAPIINVYHSALWPDEFLGWRYLGMSAFLSALILWFGWSMFRRFEAALLKDI